MKKIGLRTKLIFVSMATLIIPMAISISLITLIITRQNQTSSYGLLTKSIDIIWDDLQSQQKKLIADAGQVAGINEMGSKIRFILDYKKQTGASSSMTDNIYYDMAKDIFQILRTGNLWQTVLYDIDGDLNAFALQQDDGTFFVGYPSATGKSKLHVATIKDEWIPSAIEWKDVEIPSNFPLKLNFGKELPKENLSIFEPIDGFIRTIGYVPVMGNEYNKKTEKMEKNQVGVGIATQKINKAFVEKMSSLTGMKVNIFVKEVLSVGTLPRYNKLAAIPKGKNGPQKLGMKEILWSEMDVENESYFQGVLPLHGTGGPVGSIVALYSKNVAKANVQQVVWLLAAVYGGSILVFVPLSILFSHALVKPIRKCVAMAEDISEGDFSQRIDVNSQDEVGALMQAFNKMADSLSQKANLAAAIASGDLSQDVPLSSSKDMLGQVLAQMTSGLNDILGQVNDSVARTATGAAQVSNSSQALSQGATEQAASLEEISSSLMQLASQTKSNADNAFQANQLASAARKTAETGNDQMGEMTLAMKDINDSGKEIAKIIKAIDDIAFQTNLLALNAAVEAARAGKHGKGFAVVAQEVRNLAGRSAKAAKETAELIEGSVKKVENGNLILARTAESLAGIVEVASKVADLVGEIAAASNEQAQGIAQINQGLGQIEKVTLQNTANAEETASSTAELSSQSHRLQEIVSQFKLKTDSSAEPMHNLPGKAFLGLPEPNRVAIY